MRPTTEKALDAEVVVWSYSATALCVLVVALPFTEAAWPAAFLQFCGNSKCASQSHSNRVYASGTRIKNCFQHGTDLCGQGGFVFHGVPVWTWLALLAVGLTSVVEQLLVTLGFRGVLSGPGGRVLCMYRGSTST